MKKANVTLIYSQKGKKIKLHIYILRTSAEIYKLGTSSFLINYLKNSLSSPKLTYIRKKYSSGDYKLIWIREVLAGRCLGIQVECFGSGKPVSSSGKYGEKLATVEMTMNNENYNLQWRLQDTAVLTPDYQPVDCKYIIMCNL
jgi:hypothetical protein